jgi:hypothetical protein
MGLGNGVLLRSANDAELRTIFAGLERRRPMSVGLEAPTYD